ncbi:MAG: cation:proton antiporter [Steroidobacteraceae bacterium]|nr:cation:proton antiporter [Steroidobacteraceae bacterium]
MDSTLPDILLLLAATLVVVSTLRRFALPPVLGFLVVGGLLGPFALGWVEETETTRALAEFGVVFLLFTLGLEFSLSRMIAMRHEVFVLGGAQVAVTATAFGAIAWWLGAPPAVAVVLGGAVAMSSTAIVMQQLAEQEEINRTHGRLAFGVLLFQDLAFVPFLALAGVIGAAGGEHSASDVGFAVLKAAAALAIVLAAGRWLMRPMFHEIARARTRELFTVAVLFVAMAAAWATHAVGLSLALGAFLAGMMLAETEYRYQVESGIRPFRDTLLGLFFVTIGMKLDLSLILGQLAVVAGLLAGILVLKTAIITLLARRRAGSWFKSLRTGIVLSEGGEFGFALIALLLQNRLIAQDTTQLLLAAITLSMVVSPLLIRHNKLIARFILRERPPAARAAAPADLATEALARRRHVILCGYGRVGQNVARVLDRQGLEYIAMDLDPFRVRTAREAGDPVIYGDAAEPEMLEAVGLEHASAVVVTFADPERALGIVQAVRRARQDVPLLVRTADDTYLERLLAAGATEVIPETLEAALMLVSHALLVLDVPMSRVVKTVGEIRRHRYSLLRSVFRGERAEAIGEEHSLREELHTVVIPPGAWAVDRSIAEARQRGAEVSFTAVRREGIVGRDPDPGMKLRPGDVVVLYGMPEALEHAEAVLLAG